MLATIISSSFLKAKASLKLITSLISLKLIMPNKIRFLSWCHNLCIYPRINERHSMKYCQMRGQMKIILLLVQMFSISHPTDS